MHALKARFLRLDWMSKRRSFSAKICASGRGARLRFERRDGVAHEILDGLGGDQAALADVEGERARKRQIEMGRSHGAPLPPDGGKRDETGVLRILRRLSVIGSYDLVQLPVIFPRRFSSAR